MKRGILLNADITSTIAAMGHTDSLTIGDAGLPISDTVKRIDLAVKAGLPSFIEVLGTVLEELCIEKILLAEEIKTKNPDGLKAIIDLLKKYESDSGFSVQIDFVSHEDFKKLTASSKAIIRTGEVKPYANIILYSGVVF
jgi:D-ribose pyranase